MVKHVVMWRFHAFAEGQNKNDNIKQTCDTLHALEGEISEIIELETGVNILKSDASFDLVLSTIHRNQNELEIYKAHPLHKKAASFIGRVTSERCVVDFEY